MSTRTRLLAAFAYVLVLVIVALEVPLALNLSRRVDSEIKSEAQGQAAVLAAYGIDERVASLEVDLDRLLALPHGTQAYTRVSRYPSSDIDLAFVVGDDVPAGAVARR